MSSPPLPTGSSPDLSSAVSADSASPAEVVSEPANEGIRFLERPASPATGLTERTPNRRKPPVKARRRTTGAEVEHRNAEPLNAEPLNAEALNVASATVVTEPPVRVVEAEEVEEAVQVVDERSWPVWLFHQFCASVGWCFGAASMIVILAVLASIPILQFISLGYLLEASGRITRTRRFRNGFIDINKAAHVGGAVLGTWLMLLPVQYISSLWQASLLIEEGSAATGGLRIGQFIITGMMVAHILAAWFCGGRLRHFFWPFIAPFQIFTWLLRYAVSRPAIRGVVDATMGLISPRLVQDICNWKPLTDWFVPAILGKALITGRLFTDARDRVWDFCSGLRVPYYFWLGLRGFAGTIAWLFVPIMLMIGGTALDDGAAIVSGLLGTLSLAVVVAYLPFMQAHFAAENRLVAMFEVGRVRRAFHRAPLAFLIAMFCTLAFAVPLYLLKIEFLPSELTWLPGIVFVGFMYPARLITGWAMARGRRREQPRFFLIHLLTRLGQIPVGLAFSLIILATPYLLWYGKWSLFEQHAFLVPAPFLNL